MKDTQKTPEEIKEDLFWQGIEERKLEIESRLGGKKVFPLVVVAGAGEDYVVGFALEPDLTAQLRLMDKSQGMAEGLSLEAASAVLESLVLTAETDPRILDKTGRATYWKGACYVLAQYVTLQIPVLKKK